MKRSFFLYAFALISSFIFTLSCSSEIVDDDIINQMQSKRIINQEVPDDLEVLENFETTENPIESVQGTKILITYVNGTDQIEKRKVREEYIRSGLLLIWRRGNTENTEVWVLKTVLYNATNPKIVIETENEDVQLTNPIDSDNANNNGNSQSY